MGANPKFPNFGRAFYVCEISTPLKYLCNSTNETSQKHVLISYNTIKLLGEIWRPAWKCFLRTSSNGRPLVNLRFPITLLRSKDITWISKRGRGRSAIALLGRGREKWRLLICIRPLPVVVVCTVVFQVVKQPLWHAYSHKRTNRVGFSVRDLITGEGPSSFHNPQNSSNLITGEEGGPGALGNWMPLGVRYSPLLLSRQILKHRCNRYLLTLRKAQSSTVFPRRSFMHLNAHYSMRTIETCHPDACSTIPTPQAIEFSTSCKCWWRS